jgi:hypothetical protein
MAKYTTQICDVCKKPEAITFEIPRVTSEIDPPSGRTEWESGSVDLCNICAPMLTRVLFEMLESTEEQRYRIWKKLLSLKRP